MNYTDLITHCPDTAALLIEVESVAPDRLIKDDAGNPVGFVVTKTPTVRNGAETLSVVRVNDADLAMLQAMSSITILASVPMGGDLLAELDKTSASATLYDRIHDQTPRDILDDAGAVIGQFTPPRLIGAFA